MNMEKAGRETRAGETGIGDRLRVARERRSYTVDHLAGLIGVSTKTIIRWETEQSKPRSNRLSLLAGALGVSMRWLLNGEGRDERTLKHKPEEIHREIAEGLQDLRSIMETQARRMEALEAHVEFLILSGDFDFGKEKILSE